MMKIFIVGPIKSRTRWGVEQNIRRVEERGFSVMSIGLKNPLSDGKPSCMPVIPHSMYRFFTDHIDDEHLFLFALELMKDCDATLLNHGWIETDLLNRSLSIFQGKLLYSIPETNDWIQEFVKNEKQKG